MATHLEFCIFSQQYMSGRGIPWLGLIIQAEMLWPVGDSYTGHVRSLTTYQDRTARKSFHQRTFAVLEFFCYMGLRQGATVLQWLALSPDSK